MHDHFRHFGIRKTYSLIKRYYYWPKMINTYRAFAKVSVDLIVELSTSHYHNKNILVMVDHLTGGPIAKAIPNKEATTVANTIFKKTYT